MKRSDQTTLERLRAFEGRECLVMEDGVVMLVRLGKFVENKGQILGSAYPVTDRQYFYELFRPRHGHWEQANIQPWQFGGPGKNVSIERGHHVRFSFFVSTTHLLFLEDAIARFKAGDLSFMASVLEWKQAPSR